LLVNPGECGQIKLRRNLSVWEAIGISLALMAPSMAASINPQAAAGAVGRAVPIAFALAFVGVLLVSYTFVRLTQRFHHSGSVYGFVGATLGPRAGIISGWALSGTYLFYAVTTSVAGGRFLAGLFDATGLWKTSATWPGFLFAAGGLAVVWWLAMSPTKGGTRVLLGAEAATVALIVIVVAVVVVKLAGHRGPGSLGLNFSVFELPRATPLNAVFLGVVFGFLSFAGFEAAATLGEETKRPNRDIPRAIFGVAAFGGIYFVCVSAVEMMAFGPSAKGVAAFVNSPSLIGQLGAQYVSSWIGNVITFGAMISAFSCALASTVGAARLIYALARDGILYGQLSQVAPERRTPAASSTAVVVGAYLIIGFSWFGLRVSPFRLFEEAATTGTLILLVVYVLATIGMAKLVFFSAASRAARPVREWEIVIPVVGVILLGYTLFRNLWPLPTGAGWWGPSVAIAWFVLAIAWVLARPAVASRAGAALTQAEGLASQPAAFDGQSA
jgi:amino acid transporter